MKPGREDTGTGRRVAGPGGQLFNIQTAGLRVTGQVSQQEQEESMYLNRNLILDGPKEAEK